MPILVEIGPVRRTKSATVARRKRLHEDTWEAQLWRYCDPEANVSRLLLRCPHGWYGEGTYCTVCFPKLIEGRTRAAQGAFGGLNPLIRICEFGPGRLDKFPRKGDLRVQQKGYLDNFDIFVSADHEICPYDEKWRMRTEEAVGGYIRSGKRDGVAIRAKRSKPIPDWKNDDLEAAPELTMCQVTLPRPDSGVDIEPYRVILPVCIFTDAQPAEPCRAYFDDERSVAAFQSGLYRRIGSNKWTDVAAPVEARITGKKRRPLRDNPVWVTFDYRHFGEGGPIGRTCGECAWCRSLGLQGEPIPTPAREHCNFSPECLCTLNTPYRRSIYETFSRNAAWSDDWRTERKMQDIGADLKLYRYGDGQYQVKKMCATVNKRLNDAVIGAARVGIVHREWSQCWRTIYQDEQKTAILGKRWEWRESGGYRMSERSGRILAGKPKPLFEKMRAVAKRRREVDPDQYEQWLRAR